MKLVANTKRLGLESMNRMNNILTMSKTILYSTSLTLDKNLIVLLASVSISKIKKKGDRDTSSSKINTFKLIKSLILNLEDIIK